MFHLLRQRAALSAGIAAGVLAVTAAGGSAVGGSAAGGSVAGGSAAGGSVAGGGHPGATGRAGTGSAATAVPAAPMRPLLLINGDRVVVRQTSAGLRPVELLPAAAGLDFLAVSFSCQFTVAEVTADGLPYLGRGLDPSLFDLAALRRAERNGRLPVRLTYAGRRPALPGVTITRSGRGRAAGYLTASSARIFGAALARQFAADHARASYGTDGLFAGAVTIALAGAPGPAQASPGFRMRTLTVTGRDLAGHRDNGDDVLVINADNCGTFGDGFESDNFFYHGAARFSVPVGHYWAVGDFEDFSNGGLSDHIVILPQFTVRASTTAAMDARAANSEIKIVTPRPAVPKQLGFTVVRGGGPGSAASIGWTGSGVSLWVSPTTRVPTVGTLQTFTAAQLTSPPGPGVPYAYNIEEAGPAGVIPSQRYLVQPADLATVNERYYQDVPSTGAWAADGGFTTQPASFTAGFPLPLRLPGEQVQYFSAAPSLIWSSQYWQFNSEFAGPSGGQAGAAQILRAGEQVSEDWNRYPLHPQPDVVVNEQAAGFFFPVQASAGRYRNTLFLITTPFSDNQHGHVGAGFFAGPGVQVTGRYQVDQNGVWIAGGDAVTGIPVAVALSPRPSVIRFVLRAARTGKSYQLSPGAKTVWTWRSQRQRSVMLPPAWYCGLAGPGKNLRLVSRCVVQPMMTLRYQVHGMALDGAVPAGPQLIGISAGHIQLASAAAVTGATVAVSFNEGKSWQPASVTSVGGGHFRTEFSAPAGDLVTLRVSAIDSAGGSVSETILRAYKITT